MRVLVMDTCVLIEILDRNFNKPFTRKLFQYFKLKYHKIIIPNAVAEEFSVSPKKQKKLKKFMHDYASYVEECGIKNNPKEISNLPIDPGEGDAYLQIQKLYAKHPHYYKEIFFLTSDKKAIEYYSKNTFSIIDFNELALKFL